MDGVQSTDQIGLIHFIYEVYTLEINQLKIFLAIARSGNLTRASEQLFISQPAVSSQLKLLEEDLGFQLFLRTSKGMKLTEKGRIMLDEAQSIVELFDKMLLNAKSLNTNSNNHLNIGLNTDNEILQIERFIKLSIDSNNPINFRLIQTRSEDFIRDITSNTIDAGFFYGEIKSNQIDYIQLASYSLNIVCPPSWRSEVQDLSVEKLAKLPWIWTTEGCPFSKSATDFFKAKGFKPKKIMYIDDETLIGKLVNSEIGCSILASPIAKKLQKENSLEIIDSIEAEICLNFGYLIEKKNTYEITNVINILNEIWNLPTKH